MVAPYDFFSPKSTHIRPEQHEEETEKFMQANYAGKRAARSVGLERGNSSLAILTRFVCFVGRLELSLQGFCSFLSLGLCSVVRGVLGAVLCKFLVRERSFTA